MSPPAPQAIDVANAARETANIAKATAEVATAKIEALEQRSTERYGNLLRAVEAHKAEAHQSTIRLHDRLDELDDKVEANKDELKDRMATMEDDILKKCDEQDEAANKRISAVKAWIFKLLLTGAGILIAALVATIQYILKNHVQIIVGGN